MIIFEFITAPRRAELSCPSRRLHVRQSGPACSTAAGSASRHFSGGQDRSGGVAARSLRARQAAMERARSRRYGAVTLATGLEPGAKVPGDARGEDSKRHPPVRVLVVPFSSPAQAGTDMPSLETSRTTPRESAWHRRNVGDLRYGQFHGCRAAGIASSSEHRRRAGHRPLQRDKGPRRGGCPACGVYCVTRRSITMK